MPPKTSLSLSGCKHVRFWSPSAIFRYKKSTVARLVLSFDISAHLLRRSPTFLDGFAAKLTSPDGAGHGSDSPHGSHAGSADASEEDSDGFLVVGATVGADGVNCEGIGCLNGFAAGVEGGFIVGPVDIRPGIGPLPLK